MDSDVRDGFFEEDGVGGDFVDDDDDGRDRADECVGAAGRVPTRASGSMIFLSREPESSLRPVVHRDGVSDGDGGRCKSPI